VLSTSLGLNNASPISPRIDRTVPVTISQCGYAKNKYKAFVIFASFCRKSTSGGKRGGHYWRGTTTFLMSSRSWDSGPNSLRFLQCRLAVQRLRIKPAAREVVPVKEPAGSIREADFKAAAAGDGFVFDNADAVRNHFNVGTMMLGGSRSRLPVCASQSLGPEENPASVGGFGALQSRQSRLRNQHVQAITGDLMVVTGGS
jgi:hypothetical protein